jgi:hypothetical protein
MSNIEWRAGTARTEQARPITYLSAFCQRHVGTITAIRRLAVPALALIGLWSLLLAITIRYWTGYHRSPLTAG